MRARFLPFAPPSIGDAEVDEVVDALRSGWLTTGPRTRAFEEAFGEFIGSPSALAVSSGTAAMHVALLALGIGPGDGVVVSTMTFASAGHVVEHVGAKPIFVDVDPDTLNMDPTAVSKAIATADVRIRVIAPVHLHGHPADVDALMQIADERDLWVLDDAAHALPAVGARGTIGGTRDPRTLSAFSFYATKNLATGEGGMLAGPADLVDEARRWVLHGMTNDAWRRHEDKAKWRYDIDRAGFKYNLTDVQSALGLVQLQRLPAMHERRQAIAARYEAALSALVQTPMQQAGTEHAWHIYAIRLNLDELTIDRDRFITELGARDIGASVHFIPLHTFSYHRQRFGLDPMDFPVATREFDRLVSLPIYPSMNDGDVDDVIEAVRDIVETHRR